MKKILLLSIIFITIGSLSAQPTDCRITCRSSGTTIKAFIMPTQQNVVFTSSTSVQLIVIFSLPAGNATNTTNAPVPVSVTSPLGTPVFLNPPGGVWLNDPDDRYTYAYVVNVTSAPATTWVTNTEYLAMSLTFGNAVLGMKPHIDNLLPTGGGPGGSFYFYLQINDLVRSDTEGQPFFTTNGIIDEYIATGNTFVEPLNPLPINLLSFNVEKSSDNKSTALTWSTASESNSSYFGIERSTDRINWKTVGKVNAAGNSQIVLNYEFLDKNVNLGSQSNLIVYYRLKMVDRDDSFQYSPIESVNFGNGRDVVPEENEFLVYPNPASEGIHVEWDSDMADQPTQLEFYDISGKLVHVEKVAEQTNQQYVDFTKASIQSGLCLMRAMSGDKPIQYKQIVVGQDH